LGLPYPGGPALDKLAATGDPNRFTFPIVNLPDYDFSFSGIKTAIMYFLKDQTKQNPDFITENLADLCASIQNALIKTLFKKLIPAAEALNVKDIAIAGGVSANSGLRKALQKEGEKRGWNVFIPAFQYCTDNAGMIAMAAHFKFLKGEFSDQYASPEPRLKM